MKSLAAIVFLLSLSSCTTVEFVRKDMTPTRGAVVRHAPPSNVEREAKYREAVAKEARNYCGGEYDVIKEYQAREDTGTSTGVGTGVGFGYGGVVIGGSNRQTAMYNFIEFLCK